MGPEAFAWVVEGLSADHDRREFSCGHESLDTFIRQYASQNERTGISRTFVAVCPGTRLVVGYYSIAAGSVRFQDLSPEQARRLPRYPVPVAHLGRLAVDARSRGRRLGEHLLMDALCRIARADREVAIHAVEVAAIDEAARTFYMKYGFVPLLDDPLHLYIPMASVRKLGLA